MPDIEIDIPPGKCRWFYSTDSRRNTDCSTENLQQQQNKFIGDNHSLITEELPKKTQREKYLDFNMV